MNPNSETDREKLRKAIEASRDLTAADRRRYARTVKKFAGVEEGKKNKTRPRLINLLRQSGSTMAMQLASARPRFTVDYDGPGPKRSFAKRVQVELNRLSEELHLEEVFATCVLSAFFKMGIVKAQYDENPLLFGTDNWVMAGKPSLVPLSYEEYGHDMTARRYSKLAYQFDYYDVVWDRLRENDLYEKSVTDKIRKNQKGGYEYESSSEPSARSAFGHAPEGNRTIDDMVRLIDVYLPREKLLVTWPYRMDTPPLRVMKVKDPDGPYRLLFFDDVPDNTLPASPAENEEALDDLHNSVWRTIALQIAQMRSFFAYEIGSEKDAEAQRNAAHGQYIGLRSLENSEIRTIPGPDQNVAAAAALVSNWYDRMAGNLALNAGLGAQTDTVTQEQMLQQNNGSLNSRRKYRVQKFVSESAEALKRLIWDDKVNSRESWREPPELPGVIVPANWDATYRNGEADEYACNVEAYSLTYRSPDQEANELFRTLNDLAPLMPIFAQAGKVPNPTRILQDIAELRNQKRILGWFDEIEPQQGAMGEMRQAPRTERVNIRKSAGRGADQTQQILQGMGAGGAE